MKKRKLKGFVLPMLYLLITVSIFSGMVFLGGSVTLTDKEYNYGTGILDEVIKPVIEEDKVSSSKITSPVESEDIKISIKFYSKDDTEDSQKNSLIYYENAYLPNTGVLYTDDNSFNVLTIFNGKVTEIKDDEFFGKYVVVEHSNNLKTYYYGLEELEVEINDELTTGAVLGLSKVNNIGNSKYSFLLEVYHNNKLLNPENVIGTKISDYK